MAYQSQIPYVEHGVIKPTKQIAAAHGIMDREMVLPNFFSKKNIMQFAGSEGETLTFKYPGVLPWREYEFRNDRTDPLIFDSFNEATAKVSVSGRIYNGVRITDEQNDFDDLGVLDVIPMQAEAVARGVEQYCVRAFNETNYPIVIGNAEADLFSAVLEARRVLNRLTSGATRRTLVVGSDFAAALVQSDRIAKALNVGDRIAATALEEARVGRIHGFDVVESAAINPNEAIAFVGDAFTLFTGAPQPPTDTGLMSASRAYQGIAMTWLKDYEVERLMRRSVLVTYAGTAPTLDYLRQYNETTRMPEMSAEAHFIRGIKLTLDGTSQVVNTAVNDFAKIYDGTTGWTPPATSVK